MQTFLTIIITALITYYLTSKFYDNFSSVSTVTINGKETKTIYRGKNSLNNPTIGNISSGSIVTINDKTYMGDNITMKGRTVIVDGKEQDSIDNPIINITVDGDVGEVTNSGGEINITGNVTNNVNSSQGNIDVSGNIQGDVRTSQGNISFKK